MSIANLIFVFENSKRASLSREEALEDPMDLKWKEEQGAEKTKVASNPLGLVMSWGTPASKLKTKLRCDSSNRF